MSTLYELTTDLLEIEEGLTETTGNEAEKLEEIKEIIKQEIQNKNTRIVSVILNIDSDINSIDSEIKRLQELKRVKKNTLDRLKSNIKDCMELLGTKKVETVLGNISIRKSAGSLVIEDEEKIPAIYKTVEQVVKVDKNTIKDLLKKVMRLKVAGLNMELH
ncbi:siphovirus Gp157 family protein [Clostridioides difficile CD109]|uniref:siphovirus Gp157 family protein n=1 Tax=Clostridioides difficile TaxID=1496 RepID=UPI00038C9078|nr:siphovirus Gp157 family protein [Clostridioides difficile]EQE97840.1 siphovirus Gp157 family protein [Clostridioides difficile CD109]